MNNATTLSFVRGNERIAATLAADPELVARVAEGLEQMHAADRAYAMNLATVRRAAELTQEDLAQRLGVKQSQVSRIENAKDAMLSSFIAYLKAAGVEDIALTGTVSGKPIRIDLATAAAA